MTTEQLTAEIERILGPAIDVRAPYAKFMVKELAKLLSANSQLSTSQEALEMAVYAELVKPDWTWPKVEAAMRKVFEAAPREGVEQIALEIAEIRLRAEKATKGPWGWVKARTQRFLHDEDGSCFAQISMPIPNVIKYPEMGNYDTDAEFIAHARTDIPRLLEIIAQFQAHTLPSGPLPDLEEIALKYRVTEVETDRLLDLQETSELFAALKKPSGPLPDAETLKNALQFVANLAANKKWDEIMEFFNKPLAALQSHTAQRSLDEIIHRAVNKIRPTGDGERFCLFGIIETACKEALGASPQKPEVQK